MPEAFSLNREYDFVRLEGLCRATGRPAHEWDLYIIKELLDNALDADEALWYRDPTQVPSVSVQIEYISVPPPQCQQLLVRVTNHSSFPIEKIQDIFATQWYTSRKAFLKGLTRGALGNALKTLLGIPYALHNRMAEDWKPDLKPLSICLNGTEYLPHYNIDPITQEIRLTVETKPCRYEPGTVITVGLDYFVQEIARTREEITALAEQYHVCNPQAAFRWGVEIEDQIWEQEYAPQSDWMHKFSGAAPIQWYSLADFKELLGALYREQKQSSDEWHTPLSIEKVCRYFSGLQKQVSQWSEIPMQVLQEVGQDSLNPADIEGPLAKTLYISLSKHTPLFPPAHLGALGHDYLATTLKALLPLKGNIQYIATSDPQGDPGMPFVLEVVAAYLKEGKRQIWTALNFTPTYNDPFLSRYLYAPTQPNTPVLGLRGLLDAYNFSEETPMLLFVHLICPNIEHNEFSKTEINHLPFKKVLGEALDQALNDLRRGQEEDELQLERTIYQALNLILARISERERFIPDQLLELLQQQLSQNQALALWLERSDTLDHLRSYINSYQVRNPTVSGFVARQAEALLHIPSHPAGYFSIPIEQLSSNLLRQHAVNKLLSVQIVELEPMILANNWLCRMDMALLHIPTVASRLEELLLYWSQQTDLPILTLHNGDESGARLVEQMRQSLKLFNSDQRVIDLNPGGKADTIQPAKLMPGQLKTWLLQRLEALHIPVKSLPSLGQMRQDLSDQFGQRLRGYFMERMGQRFEITNLIIDLDVFLSYTKMLIEQKIDERLVVSLQEQEPFASYATALSDIAEDFFEQFMDEYGGKVRQREHLWLEQRRERLRDE